jgi:hypothetical protein
VQDSHVLLAARLACCLPHQRPLCHITPSLLHINSRYVCLGYLRSLGAGRPRAPSSASESFSDRPLISGPEKFARHPYTHTHTHTHKHTHTHTHTHEAAGVLQRHQVSRDVGFPSLLFASILFSVCSRGNFSATPYYYVSFAYEVWQSRCVWHIRVYGVG